MYNVIEVIQMPKSNTKADNFVRLAEARTNKIIDMIMLLGNLSNKTNYSYTDKQVELIFDSIQQALDETKIKFLEEPTQKRKKFRL